MFVYPSFNQTMQFYKFVLITFVEEQTNAYLDSTCNFKSFVILVQNI